MTRNIMKPGEPSLTMFLACAILLFSYTGLATPENPDEDAELRPFHAKRLSLNSCFDRHPDYSDLWHWEDPLPDDVTEYPSMAEDKRYWHFKEIRLLANELEKSGQLTAGKAARLLEESLPLLQSDYPNYRFHYWMLFVDLASRMTPEDGLAEMEQDEILAATRNLEKISAAMKGTVIPGYKWYLPATSSGFTGPGPDGRVYCYNGWQTASREGVYQLMRQVRIGTTKEFMNLEQINLPNYHSMVDSTIKAMTAMTDEKPSKPQELPENHSEN